MSSRGFNAAVLVAGWFVLGVLAGCDAPQPKSPGIQGSSASAPPPTSAAGMRYLDDAGLVAIEQAGYDLARFRQGRRSYELYCTNCHRVEIQRGISHDAAARLAPPGFAVAHHYRVAHPDLTARKEAIAAFVANPSVETALMPGAIRRFGLMNRINLPEAQLEAIALFLAAGAFEQPPWYAEHYKEEHRAPP